MPRINSHIINYKSPVSKYPNRFEKVNWKKTLKIYYFYNNILNSRKLIFFNIIFLNKYLIKYIFGYIKYFFLLKKLNVNKVFGFYTEYRHLHILKIFKNPIKIFYEFGSGASTILIAQQLYNQHKTRGIKGKLYTFDQSKEWLDSLKRNFPVHLLEYVKFTKSLLEYSEKKNNRFLKYANLNYHNNIDAAYIDAPSVSIIKNFIKTKTAINGNLYDLIKKKKTKYIFTDKRFYHFYALDTDAKKKYRINFNLFLRSIEYILKK